MKAGDELRDEYDFAALAGGVRGKYFQQVSEGSNVILLDPDVAKVFHSQAAVNKALRLLAEVAQQAAVEP